MIIKKLKKLAMIILCFCIMQTYSFAFIGGIIGAVNNNISAAKTALHQAWMKIKVVEQIRILRQNYREAKQYHNFVKEASKHKGGIGGYIVDEVKEHAEGLVKETESDFINYMNSSKEETSYVNRVIGAMDSKIMKKLDYSENIREMGNNLHKRLVKLGISADDEMNESEMDKFNREATILELESLAMVGSLLGEIYDYLIEQEEREIKDQVWKEMQKETREQEINKKYKKNKYSKQNIAKRKRKIIEILEKK